LKVLKDPDGCGWRGRGVLGDVVEGEVAKARCVCRSCLAGYPDSLHQPASISWPIVGPVLQGYVGGSGTANDTGISSGSP